MTTVERSTANMSTKIFSLLLLVLAAAKCEDRSQKKRGIFGEHQEHINLGNSFGSQNDDGASNSWKPIVPSYGAPSAHYGSAGDLSSNSLSTFQAHHDQGASGHHHAAYAQDLGASAHAHLGDLSDGSLSTIHQPPTDLSSAQLSSASFPHFHHLGASGLGHLSGLESNGGLLSSGSLSPSFAAGGPSFGGISPDQFASGSPSSGFPSGSAFPAGLSTNGFSSGIPAGGFPSGAAFAAGLPTNELSSGDFSSLPTLGVGAPITIGRHITITNRVAVPVPRPYPVPVHRDVPVPVHHTVQVPVSRDVPVPVAKPYPVTVVKHVPYAVEKRVPYPVPHPVPYPVYKPVPVPFAKPVAVPVVKEVPYPVAKPYVVYQQKEASWR